MKKKEEKSEGKIWKKKLLLTKIALVFFFLNERGHWHLSFIESKYTTLQFTIALVSPLLWHIH